MDNAKFLDICYSAFSATLECGCARRELIESWVEDDHGNVGSTVINDAIAYLIEKGYLSLDEEASEDEGAPVYSEGNGPAGLPFAAKREHMEFHASDAAKF